MPDALVRIVLQGDEAVAGADRVSQALGRLERGEATRALRGTRIAIDELANAATGLHPVLGRVVSTLAQFGIGGATGLAAVAGFAAIGVEIKKLVSQAEDLEKSLLKMNTALAQASGTRAGRLFAAQGIGVQLEALPGAQRRALGLNRSFLAGLSSDVLAAEEQGTAAQRATLQTQQGLELLRFHQEHAKVLEELGKKQRAVTLAVDEHVLVLDKLKLGLAPTNLALVKFEVQSALLKNALSDLDAPHKARINSLIGEAAAIERSNAAFKDRQARSGPLAFGTGNLTQAGTGFVSAGATYGTRPQIDWFGRPIEDDRSGFTDLGRIGVLGAGGGKVGATGAKATEDRTADVRLAVGAALGAISGFTQGTAGGAIGGLGGAATALSGLKGISAGASSILGPLGIGLSAVSSLFGLFAGKQQVHVMIDGYDSHALSQQQQLMLALTGFKGLSIDVLSAGARDVNRTLYELGRQGRTDGMLRIPPGG